MITLSGFQIAIGLVIGTVSIFGTVFAIFFYFKNPQIATDQTTIKLRDDMDSLRKDVIDIKETHLRSVEADVKALTAAVSQLDRAVVRLSTIIDERIPKGSPNLTPPGA